MKGKERKQNDKKRIRKPKKKFTTTRIRKHVKKLC